MTSERVPTPPGEGVEAEPAPVSTDEVADEAVAIADTLLKLCDDCLPLSDDDAAGAVDWIYAAEVQMRAAADALAKAMRERANWVRWAKELGDKCDALEAALAEERAARERERAEAAEDAVDQLLRQALDEEYLGTINQQQGGIIISWLTRHGAVRPADRPVHRKVEGRG